MAQSVSNVLFNASWYLAQNPDVAESVRLGLITAESHFQQYGNTEGRAPGPLFNPQDYLAGNPDVAEAVQAGLISAFEHFTQFGAREGRPPLNLFDSDFYLSQNPDVAQAVEAGLLSATEHFLLYGQAEPRQINPFINLADYLEANADLSDAYVLGQFSPLSHLLTHGVAEGRDLGNGINLDVFAGDPAFQQAIASGRIEDALERVQDIAPFLPSFQPPAGWQAPADTPIPIDFIPPSGTKLVIPPSVVVPSDTPLPDTFEPAPAPAPPAPAPSPAPGGGGEGGGGTGTPPFNVGINDGVINFGGAALGDITITKNPNDTLTFTRGGIDADDKPLIADLKNDAGIPALSGGDKLLMTADVFAAVSGKLSEAAATVDAQGVSSSEGYNSLDAAITKIKADGGITGLKLFLDQVDANATDALMGKATGATVVASGGTATHIGHLVKHIDNIANAGITGDMHVGNDSIGDAGELIALFNKYDGHASVNATGMNADKLNALAGYTDKIGTATQGIRGTMVLEASKIASGNFAKLLSVYDANQHGVQIDAAGLTDDSEISAIISAAYHEKIAPGELKKLTLTDAKYNNLPQMFNEAALADQGENALTVNLADTGVTMRDYGFFKGIKLNGGRGNDQIYDNFGNDIIRAGHGNDIISLERGGSDTIVFESSALENGVDNISAFKAGATGEGGDVLDFSNFVEVTGGIEAAGHALDGTFDYLTSGAAGGGTDIAGRIFLWEGNDTTNLKNLIDTTASDGQLGLAEGGKAVVLFKQDALGGNLATFNIAYITGTGNNDETIEVVGTVAVNETNGLIAANFGF